jgi:hypothetical protein
VDTRTRWVVGLLICLVIGLGIALIIVAGDDSDDSGSAGTAPNPATERLTEPTGTTAPPATSTTTPSGGSPVPGGTTTSPNGEGGL